MMSLLAGYVAVLVICLTSAATVPECTISGWGNWGKCESDKCVAPLVPPHSFSVPSTPEDAFDTGRAMMEFGKAIKTKYWAELDACVKDGSCPDMMPRKSHGRQNCVNGFAGDYPCRSVDLMSFVDFDDLHCGFTSGSSPRGNDIWGWTDPTTGDEYSLVGLNTGTSFVNTTDPENPEVLGFLPGEGAPSSWRDIAVVNDAVFIVSESRGHGMQVYDLKKLRDLPASTNNVIKDYVHYDQVGNSHNIVGHPERNLIYIVGDTDSSYPNSCRGGLHVVDVTNPLQPEYAGCFRNDGYVHDAECVVYHGPDADYVGREICFCYNEDSLTIVDVEDKQNMKMLSRKDYSKRRYSHQGALTESHSILLLDDEQDEFSLGFTHTYVWDVSDLEDPILRTEHNHRIPAIDHNLYIVGDLSFQSNYEAGLRILAIDEPSFSLDEVAYFDCLPSRTSVSFSGTWSNYPYFKSGIVAIDSINYGLFLVKPHYDNIKADIEVKKAEKVKGLQRRTATMVKGTDCPVLEEARVCQAPKC
jgi:choice-of-anchor B domain-containing protein